MKDFSLCHYKRIRIVLAFLFMVCLATPPATAEDIRVEAQVNTTKVALGSSVRLTITVYGTQDAKPFELPSIEGFDGRYVGPTRNYSFINGRTTSSITFKYSLYPLQLGTFQIPSLTATIKGQQFSTQPITIEITDSLNTSIASSDDAQDSAVQLKDRIFLVLQPAKEKAFLNEKVDVKVLLLVGGLTIRDIEYPEIEPIGFSLEAYGEPRQYQKILKGLQFDIIEFNTVIYPTRTGEITLGPATLKCNVLFSGAKRRSSFGGRWDSLFGDDLFDGFFNRYEKRQIALTSDEVQLTVSELPKENKPSAFSGAVGKFDFTVSISPTQVRVGDPITLRMEIVGNGNLRAVDFPIWDQLDNFKIYEPIINEKQGGKILEQVLIPTTTEVDQIPMVRFTYFDPEVQEYRSIERGPFLIDVTPPQEGEDFRMVEFDRQEGIVQPEELGQDIVFIKEDMGSLRRKGYFFHKDGRIYIAVLLLIIVWASLFLMYRRTYRLETDVRFARRLMAPKQAKQGLKKAKQFIRIGKKEEFYDILFKTLQNYLANKMHLPIGTISPETIQSQVNLKEKNENILQGIKEIFDDCDRVRYASLSVDEGKMKESFKIVEEIIDFFERHVK